MLTSRVSRRLVLAAIVSLAVGAPPQAQAAPSLSLFWSGTTGAGTTGSTVIDAEVGDVLQLDVIVNIDASGFSSAVWDLVGTPGLSAMSNTLVPGAGGPPECPSPPNLAPGTCFSVTFRSFVPIAIGVIDAGSDTLGYDLFGLTPEFTPSIMTVGRAVFEVGVGASGVEEVSTFFDPATGGVSDGAFSVTLPPVATASIHIANEVGITGKKLIIVDKLTKAGKAKIAYVAKDTTAQKGTTNDPAQISATLDYQVPTLGAAGSAAMPSGEGWITNKEKVAKYVNKDAPDGAGAVRVAVVKPGKLLKAVLKGLGDGGSAIDIFQGGAETSGVHAATQFTVTDGDTMVRHCGEFTECARKLIAAGTGAKVVCKKSVPGASVACP